MNTYTKAVFITLIIFFDNFNAKLIITPDNIGNELVCDRFESKICMNGGTCVDWSKMFNIYGDNEVCICKFGFYGPHCEYVDEMGLFRRGSRVKRRTYAI